MAHNTPEAFRMLAAAFEQLGEGTAAAFQHQATLDGSTPIALLNHEVSAQLIARAAQAADPVYHAIAAALSQITNPSDQANLIQQMRELTAAVIEGRPDRIAAIQSTVLEITAVAGNSAGSAADRLTDEQEVRRMWTQINELEDDNARRLQAMANAGLISQRDVDDYIRERDRIRAMDPNSQERIDATQALADRTDALVAPATQAGDANATGVHENNRIVHDRVSDISATRRDRFAGLEAGSAEADPADGAQAAGATDVSEANLGTMGRVVEAAPQPTASPTHGTGRG